MAFTFQKPVASKIHSPSGAVDTQYSFKLATEESVTAQQDGSANPLTLLHRALTESATLPLLLEEFVRFSRPYFAKQHSVPALLKLVRHVVIDSGSGTALADLTSDADANHYLFVPTEITILRNTFSVHWKMSQQELLIDIPVEEESGDLEVADFSDLPTDENAEVLDVVDPRHHMDKRRVQEANLRAKLAHLKAERAYAEYVQKYGTEPSDSEEDSDSENSDSE
uniref:Uncharacterized protein n=1 Tax=viral metagenome TaxID=1070528 RepID=A0A6C0ANX0_9ZZZZ